ncbi:MAG: hypothetical protein H7Y22_11065 [Gemmatimonadaceae bacterium]|nr:hypothetical protein [Gloeobacterales cyanobacterium ES-bin-141]
MSASKVTVGLLVVTASTLLLLSFGRSLFAQTDSTFNVQFNFQPDSSAVPPGYIEEIGPAYNGRGFGWVREDSLANAAATPLSISVNARDRKRTGIDPKLNTLLHMQYPPDSSTTAVKIPAAWEYTLPNGTYSVSVSVGDQPNGSGLYDSQHTINVEGITAIERFQPGSALEYRQALVEASVTDGKLTIDAVGGTNTKLNYVEIANYPGFAAIGWLNAPVSPIPRSEAQGGVVNGKLYVLGGYVDSTYQPTRRSDVYDPANGRWTQLADMPVPTTHGGTAVVGKYIYLAGGYIGNTGGGQTFATTNVWRYDTGTNGWSAMPALPVARGSGALVMLGSELHFFGGADINRKDRAEHWYLRLDGGTSWISAASVPNPRSHMGYASIGGKIYAIGGQHGVDGNLVAQTSVHAWNTDRTWTQVASLPGPRSHISSATFVMANRILVLGGQLDHYTSVNSVLAYDPLSNSWTTLSSLPTARHSGVAGAFANQIFYTTGQLKTTTYKGAPASSTVGPEPLQSQEELPLHVH